MAQSVFSFDDYREYLRELISSKPKSGRGEIGKLAKHLGVSQTLVSQVLMGVKQFSLEQAIATTEYFGNSELEKEYFLYLVQLDRAGTPMLKKFWREKITELKAKSKKVALRVDPKKVLSEEERSVFYSSPIYSAIRLFASTSESGKTLDEVVERFEISRAKAQKVISFLTESGLLVEKNGYFKMGAQSTHLESESPHLSKHRANWRLKGLQYSEDLKESELMYSAPVSLSREDFEILRERMLQFIKEFLNTVHESPAEDIACFNLDFFWIRK